MDNKKIPTGVGATFLFITAITIGVFVWAYEKGQDWSVVTMQTPALNNEQKDSIVEVALAEPMSEWKTYSDGEYSFEFKYPKTFNIKISDYYSISDSSKERVRFLVKNWKGYVIQENTPGTFWEKASYAKWMYFSNNLKNIPLGKCSNEAMAHIAGETAADTPKTCIINRQGDLLRVETENRIIYFTKDIEIQWELNQENKNLVDKITSTFVLK